ncbi:hypothetical protein WD019_19830, partial [Fictibacillus sp. Mic-4]|uniref:hypothetical protein n=1 Tax=Fictibacillus sp. Mic-4 TaxID=3132826 RepID=UPI003CEDD901
MRKILSVMLLIVSILTSLVVSSLTVSAENGNSEELKKQYNIGIEEGDISKEISFNEWEKLVNENN